MEDTIERARELLAQLKPNKHGGGYLMAKKVYDITSSLLETVEEQDDLLKAMALENIDVNMKLVRQKEAATKREKELVEALKETEPYELIIRGLRIENERQEALLRFTDSAAQETFDQASEIIEINNLLESRCDGRLDDINMLVEREKELVEAVQKYQERLEIRYYFTSAGEKEEVPEDERDDFPDKICCLEVELYELVKMVKNATNLEGLQETVGMNFPKQKGKQDD